MSEVEKLLIDMQKESMFLEAKMKYPGRELTPCGIRPTLYDCLEACETLGTVLFYYNVGKDTFAVKREII